MVLFIFLMRSRFLLLECLQQSKRQYELKPIWVCQNHELTFLHIMNHSFTSKRQRNWWAKYINRKLIKAKKKTCTRYQYKRKVRHITQISNNLKVLSSDLSLSILFGSWVCSTLFTDIMFFVLFCFLYRYFDDFNPLTPHIVDISIVG